MNLRFWLGTLIAGWIGSLIGLFLILPLGLIVVEFVSFPLALGMGALLAALGAGWAGTLLATDGARTRLWPVVGVAEVTALLLALLFLASAALGMALLGPWLVIGVACSVMLALSATLATGRFREARQQASANGRLTLALLGLAVVLVPTVIWVASRFGLTGA
jgi:hypothetical protein